MPRITPKRILRLVDRNCKYVYSIKIKNGSYGKLPRADEREYYGGMSFHNGRVAIINKGTIDKLRKCSKNAHRLTSNRYTDKQKKSSKEIPRSQSHRCRASVAELVCTSNSEVNKSLTEQFDVLLSYSFNIFQNDLKLGHALRTHNPETKHTYNRLPKSSKFESLQGLLRPFLLKASLLSFKPSTSK